MTAAPVGFPAQPRQASLARLAAELRRRADTTRQEAVTGLRADPAQALGGRTGELFEVERALGETRQYLSIIDLAQTRAAVMQTSLEILRQLSIEFAANGQTALDSGPPLVGETLSADAQAALSSALSALNVSLGGRSLFAGNAGDRPALVSAEEMLGALRPLVEAAPTGGQAHADLTLAFTAPGDLFETTFYLGGNGDAPAAQIAPGERLAYAQRADAEPVRLLLRDLAALALAFDQSTSIPDENRRRLAEAAVAGLRSNVEGLTAMAARLGAAQARMETAASRHRAAETMLNEAYLGLAGRDQYEAASELTALEAQLETSYVATARLTNLSLANFLR